MHAPSSAKPSKEDVSGRSRLVQNLTSGWIAQFVHFISGFILPRLINDRLGQGSLGVWDFGWAIASYFTLLQGGLVSSVNRHVAQHRSVGDFNALNVTVSTIGLVLKRIALVIVLLSGLIAWYLPHFASQKLGNLTIEARWVVLLLGLTIAVQVQGAIYGGVITGCHRWTIQNKIKSFMIIGSLLGSLAMVIFGGSIISLAAVSLISEIMGRTAQRLAANRVCPELSVSRKLYSRKVAGEMISFGGKAYVNVLSQMLVNQTSSILVASTFGVHALALFSRPRALVRSLSSIIHNNSLLIVPMISSLDFKKDISEIRTIASAAAKGAAMLCFPTMIFLLIMGSDLLRLWMGENYADSILINIFALSGMMEAACFPLYRVLMGLNKHGKLGLLNITAASVTALLGCLVTLVLKWDIYWLALCIAVPSLVVNGIFLPYYTSQVIQIKFSEFIKEVWIKPLIYCIPSFICFWYLKHIYGGTYILKLILSTIVGGGITLFVYWKFAFSVSIKEKLLKKLGGLTGIKVARGYS